MILNRVDVCLTGRSRDLLERHAIDSAIRKQPFRDIDYPPPGDRSCGICLNDRG
jgi:hypothetical protein